MEEAEFQFRLAPKTRDVTVRWEAVERIYSTLYRGVEGDGVGEESFVEDDYMVEAAKTLSTLFVHPRAVERTRNGMDMMVHLFESCQLLLQYFQQSNERNSEDADRFFADIEKYEKICERLKEESNTAQLQLRKREAELLELNSILSRYEEGADGLADAFKEIRYLREQLELRDVEIIEYKTQEHEWRRMLCTAQSQNPRIPEEDVDSLGIPVSQFDEMFAEKVVKDIEVQCGDELSRQEQQLLESQRQIQALTVKYEGELSTQNQHFLELEIRLKEQRKQYEKEEKLSLSQTTGTTNHENVKHEEQLTELKRQKTQLEEAVRRLTESLQKSELAIAAPQQTTSNDNNRLNEELSRMRSELEQKNCDISHLKEESIRTKQELDQMREILTATQSQNIGTDSIVEELKKEIRRLEEEVIETKNELEQNTDAMTHSRIEQQEEMCRLTILLNVEQSQNNAYSADIEELRNEITRLKKELIYTKSELEQKSEETSHSRSAMEDMIQRASTKIKSDYQESHIPSTIQNVTRAFEDLIRQKDATIVRYESQLGELREEMANQKAQLNEEIAVLTHRLRSTESVVVKDFRAMAEKVEKSSPGEDVNSSGIPVSQFDEMFAEKSKEIEEQIKLREQREEELSRQEQQLLESQRQIQALTVKYEGELSTQNQHFLELEIRLKEQRKQYEKELSDLVDEKLLLAQSTATTQYENAKYEQQLTELKCQKTQLEEAVRKLTESLQKSELALAVRQKRTTAEFDERVNIIVQNRMEKITQELNRVKEENEQLQKSKRASDREHHELRIKLDEMRKELEAKQHILEKQFVAVRRLNNSRDQLLRELDAYRLNTQSNGRTDELEKRHKRHDTSQQIKILPSVNSKQSEEIVRLQAEIRSLTDTITKLKTRKPPPSGPDLPVQQIVKYTENESKLRKRIESINKENESKRKELEDVIESLKKVADNLQKEKAQIRKQSVSNVKYMEVVEEKRTLQKKLDSLKQDIQSKVNTSDDVESKVSLVQANHEHVKRLSEELERQEKSINELLNERAQLLKKLDFLTMEMQELRTSATLKTEESMKEAKRSHGEIKQLREQLHERELDLEDLRQRFETVKDKHEKRIELLQSEKEELVHEQRTLRQENARLEEELSELDDGFFEEIEHLKHEYFLAKKKLKHYEQSSGLM